MVTETIPEPETFLVDKNQLWATIVALNQQIGLEYDPTATAEETRWLIEADGVRPEDNLFSCGIIAARDF